jgi:hypothetical protein
VKTYAKTIEIMKRKINEKGEPYDLHSYLESFVGLYCIGG